MATITKRVGKRDATYIVRARVNGRGIKEHFKRRKDAEDRVRSFAADQLRGIGVDPRVGRQTFQEYAESWVANRNLRPRTREDYESILRRHLLPAFGADQLRKISPKSVREWYESTSQQLGRPRTAKAYRVLRAIMNTAVSDEAIGRNPCRLEGAGQEHALERPLITPQTVFALTDAMPEERRALVLLATFCSLRLGEVLALRRRSVDLLHKSLVIDAQLQEIRRTGQVFSEPKTLAGVRKVAIPPEVFPIVEDHLARFVAEPPDTPLFQGSTGHPLRRRRLYQEWASAKAATGVRADLHIHDLRHSGATLAAQAGATTKELMSRLGHSTPRAALIYQHAGEERDKLIARKMGELIATRPTQSNVVSIGGS